MLELVEALGRLGGREDFEPEFAPPGPARCSGSRSTPRRAERELGWRPETGLDEGLRLTLDSI